MAIRAWMDGDLRLAMRLLKWAQPDLSPAAHDHQHQVAPKAEPHDVDWSWQAA